MTSLSLMPGSVLQPTGLLKPGGIYVTDVEHIPANMADTTGLWTSEYFYRQAATIGSATRKVIEELISAKPIPAQAYNNVVGYITGEGKTRREALADANSKAPRGHYKRHCKVTYRQGGIF